MAEAETAKTKVSDEIPDEFQTNIVKSAPRTWKKMGKGKAGHRSSKTTGRNHISSGAKSTNK